MYNSIHSLFPWRLLLPLVYTNITLCTTVRMKRTFTFSHNTHTSPFAPVRGSVNISKNIRVSSWTDFSLFTTRV